MGRGFPAHWQEVRALTIALLPFAWIFMLAVAARRLLYRTGLLRSTGLRVPVVVVGNRIIGGTGKTPLVLALTERLLAAGFRPGIVSRGYGGTRAQPGEVRPSDDPLEAGDEAVLLAQRSS